MKNICIADCVPPHTAFPQTTKVALTGQIVSRNLIPANDFPLSLWRHGMQASATIRLDHPDEDNVFYVLDGEFSIKDEQIVSGGVISIARNAVAEVTGNGELLHYIGNAKTRPNKPGGCVHVSTGRTERSKNSSHTIYLASDCPTCSVWLHKTGGEAGRFTAPHQHTEDEIICVVEGSLLLGTCAIPAGGAVGVRQEITYSFKAGNEGLVFVNFRQADPYYVPRGKLKAPPASERVLMLALLDKLAEEGRLAS